MNNQIKFFGKNISPLYLSQQQPISNTKNQPNNRKVSKSVNKYEQQMFSPSQILQKRSLSEKRKLKSSKQNTRKSKIQPLNDCFVTPQQFVVQYKDFKLYHPSITPKIVNISPISQSKYKLQSQFQMDNSGIKDKIFYTELSTYGEVQTQENNIFCSTDPLSDFTQKIDKIAKQQNRIHKRNNLSEAPQDSNTNKKQVIIYSELLADPQIKDEQAFDQFLYSQHSESDEDTKLLKVMPAAHITTRPKTTDISPTFPFTLRHMIKNINIQQVTKHPDIFKSSRDKKKPGHQFYFDEPIKFTMGRQTPQIIKGRYPSYMFTSRQFMSKIQEKQPNYLNGFDIGISSPMRISQQRGRDYSQKIDITDQFQDNKIIMVDFIDQNIRASKNLKNDWTQIQT